ncbi:GNAT family N-acetyltransferase [Miniphocaeibacter massiliensis]|uniref:GNAT family N-acetyltransferase n=1 Tax=Miniphocaeibacter massiliensis TaxID=2041841 RepID=UPI001A9153DE|nr:GNAT family N-acetyltransferase [Miniphocaeibacter massiliensis]
MEKIKLRPFIDNDIKIIGKWLKKDYIIKWYHDSDAWIKELEQRNNEFSWIKHFIVEEDYVPIGFCQYYDCYNSKDIEDWHKTTKPNNSYSIDYLIGEEKYLKKGYGSLIVKKLTNIIIKHENLKEIIVKPEEENIASIKSLISNGYKYDKNREYYYKNI